jgi:hypothetical protein
MSGRFRPLLYVFFFALFPVLSLLSANINEMALVEGLRAAVLALTAAGGLLLAMGLFTGQWHRAGLIIALTLLFFLSFGHIYKFILDVTRLGNTDSTYLAAAVLWMVLGAGLAALAWFRLKRPEHFTQNLNIISLAMLLLPIFNLTSTLVGGSAAAPLSAGPDFPNNAGQTTSFRPDIYYIILDGYARADVLSAVFQHDNGPFINALEDRGFFVAANSHSNYLNTTAALASSLNLQYLDELARQVGPESTNLLPLSNMVQNNRVQFFLDSLNYETITISSGYNNTESRRADHYLTSSFRGINNFEALLLQHTPVGRYIVRPGGLLRDGLQYAPHRDRILFAFDSLAHTVSRWESPKFVFAHIVAPHPPFVFGPEGEAIQPDYAYTLSDGSHFPGTAEEYIEGYRNQLIYINKLVLEAVDQILNQSQSTPIIIIQSDHGSGAFLNWSGPENNSCLKERASNFTAVLTPDSRAQFYDSMTPVNIFPILFNSYFDMSFELLPDKSFFVVPTRPFDFIEITGQIDTSDACLTGQFPGQ